MLVRSSLMLLVRGMVLGWLLIQKTVRCLKGSKSRSRGADKARLLSSQLLKRMGSQGVSCVKNMTPRTYTSDFCQYGNASGVIAAGMHSAQGFDL